jgi:hypothetical protein
VALLFVRAHRIDDLEEGRERIMAEISFFQKQISRRFLAASPGRTGDHDFVNQRLLGGFRHKFWVDGIVQR